MFIIPLLQVLFILLAIVSGGIYFEEFDTFDANQFIGFIFGVLTVCGGLYFLSPAQSSGDGNAAPPGDEGGGDHGDEDRKREGYQPPRATGPGQRRAIEIDGEDVAVCGADGYGGAARLRVGSEGSLSPPGRGGPNLSASVADNGYFGGATGDEAGGGVGLGPGTVARLVLGGALTTATTALDVLTTLSEVMTDDFHDMVETPREAERALTEFEKGVRTLDPGATTGGWLVTSAATGEVDWRATTAQLNLLAAAQQRKKFGGQSSAGPGGAGGAGTLKSPRVGGGSSSSSGDGGGPGGRKHFAGGKPRAAEGPGALAAQMWAPLPSGTPGKSVDKPPAPPTKPTSPVSPGSSPKLSPPSQPPSPVMNVLLSASEGRSDSETRGDLEAR